MFFILPPGNLGIEKLNNLPNCIALYSQHDLITVNMYLFQNSTLSPKLFLPLYGVFLPLLMSKIICQLWEEDCYHYWLCGCIDVSPCGHPDEKPEATITHSLFSQHRLLRRLFRKSGSLLMLIFLVISVFHSTLDPLRPDCDFH